MPAELSVAIVGVGFMGSAHARAARLTGARLVGVAASSRERAKDAATRLGADRAFPSAEALVTDPDVDVVHLCVPNDVHAPLATMAFAHGKHVICEKPLTLDGASADELLAAQVAAGTVGAVPFVYRFHPMVRELRARIAADELGPLHLVHGTYLQDWLAGADDRDWRLDPAAGGRSRAFADIGSHWFDLVEFVTGARVTRISARFSTAFATRSNEDVALVQFELSCGALGSVVVSQVSPGRKNALVIECSGARGSGRFDQEAPGSLWLGRQAESIVLAADPARLAPDAARLVVAPAGHPQGYLDCIDQFVADTYATIAGAQPVGLPTFADGCRSVHLVDTALQSAGADGAWIEVGRVKLGFLTACLPGDSLEEIAAFASATGFEALEVAAWPGSDTRPFTATHVVVDPLTPGEVARVRGCLDDHGLSVSSLAYYGNNLHPDAGERRATNDHVARCIEAAAELGSPTVGTFIGRDPGRSVADNLATAEAIFAPLVDSARACDVEIVIENCVMEGWHPDGYPGNLAYSPELWEWMFALGLKLNFDPSHLMWLGIDPVSALRPYVDHVAHVQAKDIQCDAHRRNRYGFFGKAVARDDPWDTGWWRYRLPGLGDVDFAGLIDVLYEGGFDGTVSVEHEDPVWGGDPDRVRTGLAIAYRTLRPLIVEEDVASSKGPRG